MAKGERARTVGELRRSGYKVLSVKEELRKNLVAKLQRGEQVFPGIIGFDDTVIPQVENAILAGHDLMLLGERGQAKSRLIRRLVDLLDEAIPVIAGCDINDDPYDPVCRRCKDLADVEDDALKLDWLPRERRYGEKLATPDVTVADLIGEIDPVKVAEGRYLSDELTIHFGLIPRTNRGIFSINELPDLSERIQVGLFNLMEERDVQVKGYRILLPLDLLFVASANPEDYTNRGRIITPLKDRFGAQVRTHYPTSIEDEVRIVEQERATFPDVDKCVTVPGYMKEVVAELTALARRSGDINQRSGVSVRVSIANYETMVGAAFKRSVRLNEAASPRISDLHTLAASTTGKIELETIEEGREGKVFDDLVRKAVHNVFGRRYDPREFEQALARFSEGLVLEVGGEMPSSRYVDSLKNAPELAAMVRRVAPDGAPHEVASALEFVLEGLHLSRKLNRDRVAGRLRYRGQPQAQPPDAPKHPR